MDQINIKKSTTTLLLIGVLFVFIAGSVGAATTLDKRSLKLSDQNPNANGVKYTVEYHTGYAYNLGSIVIDFCSNSPLPNLPCDPITGFSASQAVLSGQSGIIGFSVLSATNNRIVLTRNSTPAPPTFSSLEFNNMHNPANTGTSFGRINTYSSTDGTGSAIEEGGMTFVIIERADLSVYVPPSLSLCVAVTIPGLDCSNASGIFVDMGELSSNRPNTATSQFVTQTNAEYGYNVLIIGVTPTSGNNVIPAMNAPLPSQVGVSQFGINLRRNDSPAVGSDPVGLGTDFPRPDYNTPNRFKYLNGDVIHSTNTTTFGNKVTVTYLINVSNSQDPGIYNSTFVYTALASF